MEDFRKYEKILGDKLKEILRKEGLKDSGNLIDSVAVTITGQEITIVAYDYYKYLDNKHNLTDQLMNSQEMEDFTNAYMVNELTQNINTN